MARLRRVLPPRRQPRTLSNEPPSLLELERFSQANLAQWQSASLALDALHRILFFELEPQRQRDEQALLDAVRASATTNFAFDGWCRIVDYRYSLMPLAVEGSLEGIGGRFNVGRGISPGTFTAFPALHVADEYAAAFKEKFPSRSSGRSELGGDEFALRKPGSFSQVRLRGRLDLIIDVGDRNALKPFADVIRQFGAPKSAGPIARRLAGLAVAHTLNSWIKRRPAPCSTGSMASAARFRLCPAERFGAGRVGDSAFLCRARARDLLNEQGWRTGSVAAAARQRIPTVSQYAASGFREGRRRWSRSAGTTSTAQFARGF